MHNFEWNIPHHTNLCKHYKTVGQVYCSYQKFSFIKMHVKKWFSLFLHCEKLIYFLCQDHNFDITYSMLLVPSPQPIKIFKKYNLEKNLLYVELPWGDYYMFICLVLKRTLDIASLMLYLAQISEISTLLWWNI